MSRRFPRKKDCVTVSTGSLPATVAMTLNSHRDVETVQHARDKISDDLETKRLAEERAAAKLVEEQRVREEEEKKRNAAREEKERREEEVFLRAYMEYAVANSALYRAKPTKDVTITPEQYTAEIAKVMQKLNLSPIQVTFDCGHTYHVKKGSYAEKSATEYLGKSKEKTVHGRHLDMKCRACWIVFSQTDEDIPSNLTPKEAAISLQEAVVGAPRRATRYGSYDYSDDSDDEIKIVAKHRTMGDVRKFEAWYSFLHYSRHLLSFREWRDVRAGRSKIEDIAATRKLDPRNIAVAK